MDDSGHSPVTSVPGVLTLATWSAYVLLAAFYYYPDILPSVLTTGLCGLLACLAVVLKSAYWRLVAILASCVYLAFYAVRVIRMIAMSGDFQISSLLSALGFYYRTSWHVIIGILQERGVAAGMTRGFLEYAMPVLSMVLIVVVFMSWRAQRRESRAG